MNPDGMELVRALYRAGRVADARSACGALCAERPGDARALAVAGMLALKSGDAAAAEQHYREALARDPSYAEAHFNWGSALLDWGRHAEAAEALRRALELRPELPGAHNNLGSALAALGDGAGAEACYHRALELAPKAAHVHRNLGNALHARGALAEALDCFARAVALRPDWPRALQSQATTAMEAGQWPLAGEACQRWLALEPANVEALGLLSLALDELGQSQAAAELLDVERLFAERRLEQAPAGHASVDAFNRALSAQILSDPSLRVPAQGDARYHCASLRLSGELPSGGPAGELRRWVEAELSGYLAELRRALPAHPFVAGGPRKWRLESWAAVLDGEGQLEPHVHYASYVSAVYYASVPSRMQGGPQAGWFELSGGPSRFPCTAQRPPRAFRPSSGALWLFPSYFYHRTLPFRASEPRISLAFDCVPLRAEVDGSPTL